MLMQCDEENMQFTSNGWDVDGTNYKGHGESEGEQVYVHSDVVQIASKQSK